MAEKKTWLVRAALGAVLTLVALAPAASAVRRYRLQRWRAQLDAAFEQARRGDDAVTFPPRPDDDDGEVEDDATARRLAELAWRGPRGALFQRELLSAAHDEAARWPELMPGAAEARLLRELPRLVRAPALLPFAAVAGLSWANLGPTAANFEWNGSQYNAQDSGRPNSIRVDPRSPDVVYLATSGGGIWKTYDFTNASPSWIPITETLGNLAIGAFDEDPNAARADTLWAGLGDFVDTAGGVLVRSTNGGASWSATIALTGTYPGSLGPNGTGVVTAASVRDLRIDPNNPDVVLAATEVGLFRSVNATSATPSFALVDLPNAGGDVEESVWTFAYTGSVAGVSHWVASGVYACDTASFPPLPGTGLPAGNASCSGGNLGDLWISNDAGGSWVSERAAGHLGAAITAMGTDVGRMAAGASGAVVYVEAGSIDEGGGGGTNVTAGILKKTMGGAANWAALTTSTAAPTNPTTSADCPTMDLGHVQSWYNLAVAVDPANAAHAVFGGNLCGARTTDGGATFDLISHWLPSSGQGNTAAGTLPYVHADWHAGFIAAGVAYAGTDGGLFASSNLFSASPPSIAWAQPDVGIVSHLSYSIASGDPVDGNTFVAFTGEQDNGTRFRDATTDPTVFNQVIGGDGIGATTNNNGSGGNQIYWAVNPGGPRSSCKPSATKNCNVGGAWSAFTMSKLPGGDTEPFLIHFSPLLSETNSSVLTHTDLNVYRIGFTTMSGKPVKITSANLANHIRNVHAAPQTFLNGISVKRLYGVALSGGNFAIGVDAVPPAATVAFTQAKTPVGTGTGAAGVFERYTTSVAFPCKVFSGVCTNNGQTYLAATAAPVLSDGVTPVPASMGHLFKTTNNGTSWAAFHGNGTGADLPNVPIEVIRFDPGDNTDNTLYAGTDLGLYRSTDGGNTWARFGAGLPMVRVSDLFVAKNGGLLRIGTYGRGLWEIFPAATDPHGVVGDGDFDRNLQIDFLDLGALASRLGTSPATSAQPLYDWNLDLTGTVNAIDESDLTALLAKFGSTP